MTAEMKSLDQFKNGQCGVVHTLGAGKEFASRLSAMGLAIGSPLKVIQNRGRGPLLILVRDTRIALGRGEAVKIMVVAQDCVRGAMDG